MNLSTLTPASTTSANGSSFANNNTSSSPTITLSSSIKSRIREDEYNKRNYNEDNSYSSYPSSSSSSFIPTTNNNYQQSSSSTCTTIPFSSEDGNPHIKSSTTINNSLSYNNHYYNKIIFEDEDYLYRTIHRDDLPQLQKLQQELFPVKYNKQFYLKLLDKEKTYTLLAFFKRTNELVGVCSCSLLQEDYNESTALTSSSSSNNNNNSNSGLGYYLNNFLNLITLSSPEKINICYIMTLGVKCTHRRKGLASKMLQILEEVVSIEPYDCLKLTLHCKIDNQQALAFYKQNAFVIKDTIEDYYDFGSHLEGAYKLEKDLSHMRNDHWKEQELMGKRSSSPTSSSSNGSMISSPSSRSTPLLSHSDKYHQTMSTMSCLTFSVQICKIIVESFKFVVLDTYYTISKVILPSSSNQEVYHMNATSNYPTTTTNHPNRPRIVLQVQEQENLQ
ncbi:hypothetical protein ABK040_003745 [Willaertia magna]